MASLEEISGWYRVIFRYQSKKYSRGLDTKEEKVARRLKDRIEENLDLLKRGRLVFSGGDLVTFLLSDGKLNEESKVPTLTLKNLFAMETPWKDESTQATEKIHKAHILRLLGNILVRGIDQETAQSYIRLRAKECAPVTIKKEIGTLSSFCSMVNVPFPRGLKYPKEVEKPPFQTWAEIEQKVQNGAEEELWDSLFLTPPEIEDFIGFAKENARPFVHTMIVFAAHTGARRSELMRSLKEDVNFSSGMVTIREKKKDKSKTFTYRHVPMSDVLQQSLQEWFAHKECGRVLTFAAKPDLPLSPQLSSHHFRWLVDDSKWTVIKGWHVLRHSFITACVMKGIDQRMIDLWTGHTTESMRKRYTHLIPSAAKVALKSVFGSKQ